MPFPKILPTIPALVRFCAARFGDKPFLIADAQVLTYTDLDQRSAALAIALLGQGIGKGDHVGILMPNSVDWALAWFATTRIGAVVVPLNTFYQASDWPGPLAMQTCGRFWRGRGSAIKTSLPSWRRLCRGWPINTSQAASPCAKPHSFGWSRCGEHPIGPGRQRSTPIGRCRLAKPTFSSTSNRV